MFEQNFRNSYYKKYFLARTVSKLAQFTPFASINIPSKRELLIISATFLPPLLRLYTYYSPRDGLCKAIGNFHKSELIGYLLISPSTSTSSSRVQQGTETKNNIFYFLILFCEFYRIPYRLIKTLAFNQNP